MFDDFYNDDIDLLSIDDDFPSMRKKASHSHRGYGDSPFKSATLHKGVSFAETRKHRPSLQTGTHIADMQRRGRGKKRSASREKQASHLYTQTQLDGLCPNPCCCPFFSFPTGCTKVHRKRGYRR